MQGERRVAFGFERPVGGAREQRFGLFTGHRSRPGSVVLPFNDYPGVGCTVTSPRSSVCMRRRVRQIRDSTVPIGALMTLPIPL